MKIAIEKDTNLDRLEVYYKLLNNAADIDAKVDIALPKSLDNYFVGLVPALIQFLITWSKYKNAGDLFLDIANPIDENFEDILQNELLFPAYTLAWHKSNFFNSTGKVDIRNFLKEPLAKIRSAMVRARPMKGNKLLLTSIDHFPFASGAMPAFETPDGFIDNKANTMSNLRPALESILSFSHEAKKEFKEYGMDFITIVHELYKNTHEWARTDSNNVSINPCIRGCLIKFYKKRRATLVQEYKFHNGLRTYFESPVHLENQQTELYFIEISVFDSGIGFVEKFDSPEKPELSDIEIIKRCLMLHMTSAKGLDKDNKGFGLDEILNTLDGKGFLRIKTNKRCIYRNMITHPYKKVDREQDLDLFDWDLNSSSKYSELLNAAGACVTIIYPLSTKL